MSLISAARPQDAGHSCTLSTTTPVRRSSTHFGSFCQPAGSWLSREVGLVAPAGGARCTQPGPHAPAPPLPRRTRSRVLPMSSTQQADSGATASTLRLITSCSPPRGATPPQAQAPAPPFLLCGQSSTEASGVQAVSRNTPSDSQSRKERRNRRSPVPVSELPHSL